MSLLYIALFHGRTEPDEQLDDWGFDGPVIGPIGLNWTYGTLKVHNPEYDDHTELPIHNDLVAYHGAYYGDFDIFVEGDAALTGMRIQEGRAFHNYEEFKENLQHRIADPVIIQPPPPPPSEGTANPPLLP